MKRYEMLILEWDLGIPKETILREEMGGFSKGGLIGAGVGGGIGVISAARNYLKQRAILQNQMAECVDDQCRMQIKAKLDALKSTSIRSGLGRGMAGAAGGAVVGAGVGTGMQLGRGITRLSDISNMPDSQIQKISGPNITRDLGNINALTSGDKNWGNLMIGLRGVYGVGSAETGREIESSLARKTPLERLDGIITR